MDSNALQTPFNLKISPLPFPDAHCLRAASNRSSGPPKLQRPDKLTPLSLSSSMGIKPESPPAPARNSGRRKPSEAPPRRTIDKRYDTQLNATFTELRDSIPSMRVRMAKEGEENVTKDPHEGTLKTIVDKNTGVHFLYIDMVGFYVDVAAGVEGPPGTPGYGG
ncbi:hypothetical protein EDB81DRAFT_765753 [Dactylonectria macrodidyma]|uniref:Uncharacterized protein n=1 Tax=Dactylonectria macrodidyma TaxID=307937 RepID=A0A9P9DST6_9HYPO|nr:hypothetical protein EDB81DRAFT_765753 [Dactylonectria macrodidyma]